MSSLLVMLVVAVIIPALLIFAVTVFDIYRDEHPHRRLSDH